MASAIFNPPCLSHPSSPSLTLPKTLRKPPICAQISCSRTLIIRPSTSAPHLGITPFSNWNGLKKTGFSISLQSLKLEKIKKCKRKGVFASLFGVGAPEALVIGVVALLVFGPKGLAEVAKTMGKTLRSFQPTIRELQEVSREFKSTLEKEIGIDDLQNPLQGNYTSNMARSPPDTLQNSQSTVTPSAADTTTEDSQATTTTPAGGDSEDSQETVTTSDVSVENSQETVTTSDVSLEDSQEKVITSDVGPEDSPETTAVEDSQPIVDDTNGSPSIRTYSSEDLLKITEEQLNALASQQQKDQLPSPDIPKSEI